MSPWQRNDDYLIRAETATINQEDNMELQDPHHPPYGRVAAFEALPQREWQVKLTVKLRPGASLVDADHLTGELIDFARLSDDVATVTAETTG